MPVILYKHNKETYKNIINAFEEKNRVGVVQPTGTGKSFLILKWLEDNADDTFIVLSPSVEIFNQLERYAAEMNVSINKKVSFITYEKLNFMKEDEVLSLKADKIVLDEFHRAGAEQWGKSIDTLLDNNAEAQILGLTATPVRYLDDARNMADELFDGNIAREMTLGEAVAEGILPIPEYVPVWYDYNNIIDKSQDSILLIKDKKKRKELEETLHSLKNHLENSYGAKDIFKAHMPTNHGKWIVFCRNIEHIDEIMSVMNDWLSDVNKNIHSYISIAKRTDKDKQLCLFMEDRDNTAVKLLYTVDRFNEGVHIDGVEGVIMLRPTTSPIIYLQQMGRALSSKGTRRPVIFDMVNNYQNIMVDYGNGKENVFERDFTTALKKESKKKCFEFKIFENFTEFEQIIKEITFRYSPWTEEELEILKTYYIPGIGVKSFQHLLPGRSRESILSMAKLKGLTEGYYKEWTEEELEILKTYYIPGKGIKTFQHLLPGRTRESILSMAKRINITEGSPYPEWTEEEIKQLETYIEKGLSYQEISICMPNRSQGAIAAYCQKKKIRATIKQTKTNGPVWTNEELDMLKEHYKYGCNIEALKVYIPNRSSRAIRNQITRLNLTGRTTKPRSPWTEEESLFLIKLYEENKNITQIAKKFPSRTRDSVAGQIRKLKQEGRIISI